VGRRGDETVAVSVVATEGEQTIALLHFASSGGEHRAPDAKLDATEPSEDGSSTRRTIGWVAVGAGGLGLAVGAVAGVLAMNRRADIDDNPNCQGDACAPSEGSEVDTLNSLRTTSTVAFITGGVFAGTGLVLVLTSGPKAGPSASAYVAPGSVGVRGRF
jgi:hypothetical protein